MRLFLLLIVSTTSFLCFTGQGSHTSKESSSTIEQALKKEDVTAYQRVFTFPRLITSEINSLESLLADVRKKATTTPKMILVAIKTHACDSCGQDCLKLTRDLGDEANAFLSKNFIVYHTTAFRCNLENLKRTETSDFIGGDLLTIYTNNLENKELLPGFLVVNLESGSVMGAVTRESVGYSDTDSALDRILKLEKSLRSIESVDIISGKTSPYSRKNSLDPSIETVELFMRAQTSCPNCRYDGLTNRDISKIISGE